MLRARRRVLGTGRRVLRTGGRVLRGVLRAGGGVLGTAATRTHNPIHGGGSRGVDPGSANGWGEHTR